MARPSASSNFADAESYLRRLRADEATALREIITIKDKRGRPVPLNPWPGQLKYLTHCARINDVIKVRQQGLSLIKLGKAVMLARLALYFPELRNRQYTIFTKADEDAAIMFNHVRFMDTHLPDAFRGAKIKDSAKAIHYEDTGCLIRIMTAGKTEGAATAKGRSATDFGIHITEAGYIEHLASLLAGALGSLVPDGEVTMESTSSGPRGFFSQHFLGIVQNGREIDKNIWAWDDRRSMFFGFLDHPEYVLPVTSAFRDEDEEEERLLKLGAEPGKILWRRAKIADYGKGSSGSTLPPETQFKRDYPSTLQDAFEEAGGSFFRPKIIASIKSYVDATWPEPVELGLRIVPGDRPTKCLPTAGNRFTIYKPPIPGWRGRYAFFADVGQGRPDGDGDVGYMGDLLLREVVAKYNGKLGPMISAQNALALCSYYHNAWLAADMSGIGAEMRPYLTQSGYPRLWCRWVVDNISMEPLAVGLVWDQANRAAAVGRLRSATEGREWTNPDPDFYAEAEYFGYHDPDSIKPEAATGFHDDRPMAYAGLIYIADRCPAPVEEIPVQPFQDVKTVSLQKQLRALRKEEEFSSRLAKGFNT